MKNIKTKCVFSLNSIHKLIIAILIVSSCGLIFTSSCAFGQKRIKKERPKRIEIPSVQLNYDNVNYIPEIKSVEFYNDKKEQSFPVLNLGSTERLLLKFDDLRPGNHSLSYSVVHCDATWLPTSISSIEYLESFSEDRINTYRISFNTYQKYTHYELILPNLTVIPKLSGNYLLKVYDNGDASKLLFTRRFYIVNAKVVLQAEIIRTRQVAKRESKQKVNFSVFHPNLNIQNPYIEIRAVVMQNSRSDISQTTLRPLFIRNNQLIYTDDYTNDFEAGNEFRRFDTRSFRYKSEGVYSINKDSLFNVNLFTNISLNTNSYSYQFDEDGNFYVRNQDGSSNDYDADYGKINFSLKATPPDGNGFVYVVGKFNAYQKNKESKMIYNPETKQFSLSVSLKQGITDYHYTWVDENGKTIDDTIFDGSFFETENDYQILIYYKAPGSRYDELIAFSELNTVNRIRNY